jgi:hypothetical protein
MAEALRQRALRPLSVIPQPSYVTKTRLSYWLRKNAIDTRTHSLLSALPTPTVHDPTKTEARGLWPKGIMEANRILGPEQSVQPISASPKSIPPRIRWTPSETITCTLAVDGIGTNSNVKAWTYYAEQPSNEPLARTSQSPILSHYQCPSTLSDLTKISSSTSPNLPLSDYQSTKPSSTWLLSV